MKLQDAIDHFAKGFNGNFYAMFNISDDEAERIAEKSNDPEEFERIWENDDWWTDENQ